ncbi:Histone H1 [Melia azedarach]|uniref:Histone H1 n=1 Tax=Melia azedarach TaxID=155640 RepID=A0ACC1YG09_MELAZ|nr:Histone H1 [Melia azedarach]
MASATVKTAKEGKAKNATSAPRKPRAHPPYSEMINEAILALKERTGSSQFAIAKFIEEKQKANLPNNYKKLLLVQLKKLVANGKLVKVKNSFKLPPKSSSTSDTAKKPKSSSTSAAAKKPKSSSASAAAKKQKTTSTTDAGKRQKTTSSSAAIKKPKSSSASEEAKKHKSSSTSEAANKTKPKSKAKEAAVKPAKSPAKKAAVAAKAKKPKSIKSPVKKVVAKRGKK